MLFLVSLLLVGSTLIWEEDFTNDLATVRQLYNYTISIAHKKGAVSLQGSPQKEGGSTAWFYVDQSEKRGYFTKDHVLELNLTVPLNKARISYYYMLEGAAYYHGGQIIVEPKEESQTIEIPFAQAKPFYSGNFPYALTPNKVPALFVFIDNLEPGAFEVLVDRIAVTTALRKGE